jgi:hypothetical protein
VLLLVAHPHFRAVFRPFLLSFFSINNKIRKKRKRRKRREKGKAAANIETNIHYYYSGHHPHPSHERQQHMKPTPIQIDHLTYASGSSFNKAQSATKKSAILGRLIADDAALIAAYVLATHPDCERLTADGVYGFTVVDGHTDGGIPYRLFAVVRPDRTLATYSTKHLRASNKAGITDA